MRWKEITEAPIADFGTYGDMSKEGSFRANDLKAMTNPKWQAKLKRMFENTEFPINLYLFNAPDDIEVSNRKDVGHGPKQNPYRDIRYLQTWSGIRKKDEIENLLGRSFVPADYEQAITVVLIENEGDERIALTPWMVAHRISHAFLIDHDRYTHYEIANLRSRLFPQWNQFVNAAHMRFEQAGLADYKDIYERYEMKRGSGDAKYFAISEYLGLTKGMKKLSNPGEFMVESFAQYMVQGRVKYRRVDLPGYSRRRPLTPEEFHLIQDSSYDYYKGTVDTYIERNYPAPPKPRGGFLAINSDGEIVASFQDPARAAKYEAEGLAVKERKPSWQSKKKYAEWEAQVAKIREMWARLDAEGRMDAPFNRAELLDNATEEFENFLNETFRAIMVRCIGKFLVL